MGFDISSLTWSH